MFANIDNETLAQVHGGAASSSLTMVFMMMLFARKSRGLGKLNDDERKKALDLLKGISEAQAPKKAEAKAEDKKEEKKEEK